MPKRGLNIYKRKDGRWEGRLRLTDDEKTCYIYGKSYGEVKRKILEYKESSMNDILKPVDFSEICKEWLNNKVKKVKESTFVKYSETTSRYIEPYFNKYKPSELTVQIIEDYIFLLQNTGLSNRTIRDILKQIKSILKYGKCQYTAVDEALKSIQTENKRVSVFSTNDREKLEKYLFQNLDSCKLGIFLALYTGMRIGEICALKWSDVDLENDVISVNKTIQRIKDLNPDSDKKTKIITTPPKSKAGIRTIPIPSFLHEILLKFKSDENSYILTNSEDFTEPRMLGYHYKKVISECGISDHNFHCLRHTFATRCVEVGFDIKSLSEILGHSSVTVTMALYVHPTIEHKRANMEKLVANF